MNGLINQINTALLIEQQDPTEELKCFVCSGIIPIGDTYIAEIIEDPILSLQQTEDLKNGDSNDFLESTTPGETSVRLLSNRIIRKRHHDVPECNMLYRQYRHALTMDRVLLSPAITQREQNHLNDYKLATQIPALLISECYQEVTEGLTIHSNIASPSEGNVASFVLDCPSFLTTYLPVRGWTKSQMKGLFQFIMIYSIEISNSLALPEQIAKIKSVNDKAILKTSSLEYISKWIHSEPAIGGNNSTTTWKIRIHIALRESLYELLWQYFYYYYLHPDSILANIAPISLYQALVSNTPLTDKLTYTTLNNLVKATQMPSDAKGEMTLFIKNHFNQWIERKQKNSIDLFNKFQTDYSNLLAEQISQSKHLIDSFTMNSYHEYQWRSNNQNYTNFQYLINSRTIKEQHPQYTETNNKLNLWMATATPLPLFVPIWYSLESTQQFMKDMTDNHFQEIPLFHLQQL